MRVEGLVRGRWGGGVGGQVERERDVAEMQGYLAHKKTPTPLGAP